MLRQLSLSAWSLKLWMGVRWCWVGQVILAKAWSISCSISNGRPRPPEETAGFDGKNAKNLSFSPPPVIYGTNQRIWFKGTPDCRLFEEGWGVRRQLSTLKCRQHEISRTTIIEFYVGQLELKFMSFRLHLPEKLTLKHYSPWSSFDFSSDLHPALTQMILISGRILMAWSLASTRQSSRG